MNELFLKVLNMSISASLVVLAVLVLRLLLKKAPKWIHVLLWSVVAVRLLCPVSFESPVSLMPDSIGNGELLSELLDDYVGEVSIIHDNSIHYDAAIAAGREPVFDESGGRYVVTNYDQLGEPSTIENTIMPVLSMVWVSGMILLALFTGISYWSLCRKVNTAVLYRSNIFQSEHVSSPFVLGLVRPKIYLPYKLNDQEMEHVISHEQVHIQRKDHWWKPFGFLLLTIHWFNPLMWFAYVLLCRDIELACDEKVIRNLDNEQRADYSQVLVSCSTDQRMITACPLAFGEVGVKERVKSVMNYKKPTFWVIMLAVFICIFTAVCFLTDPMEPTLYDIVSRENHSVLSQEQVDLTLTVSKAELPDAIYTSVGYEFDKNEVVAYQTETTTIYLYKAMLSNESDGLMYFIFDFSYDFADYGKILSPFGYEDGDIKNELMQLRSKDLRDNSTIYPDALSMRGYGPETQVAFYVSLDACMAAEENILIDVVCNKLVYAKTGFEAQATKLITSDNTEHGETVSSTFTAKILEVLDGYFLVEPTAGSLELNSADRIEVPMMNMDPSKEPLVGDFIEISYNGEILESYPAQLNQVYSIRVVEEPENASGAYSADILTVFKKSINGDDTVIVTDHVYADDNAYGLDGVVQYADETGSPWKLAFIRDGVSYPVSQDWGTDYIIASELSYIGNGVVKVYIENTTDETFHECTMAYSYDAEASQTNFKSESKEVSMDAIKELGKLLIDPIAPVSVENLIMGVQTNITSNTDIRTLSEILFSDRWADGSPACDNDFKVTINGKNYWYHSDCGTFVDIDNNCSISLNDDELTEVNRILTD